MKRTEIIALLEQNHVVSFHNAQTRAWAGYSPSDGLFWADGENFKTAEETVDHMAKTELRMWYVVDNCIDDTEEDLLLDMHKIVQDKHIWTCPGEDAGACDSRIRGDYEGPCETCPLRR